jgi:hypothetical protein
LQWHHDSFLSQADDAVRRQAHSNAPQLSALAVQMDVHLHACAPRCTQLHAPQDQLPEALHASHGGKTAVLPAAVAAAAAGRLVLALMQQPWFEPPVEPLHALVRSDLDSYPFRQLPRFVDEVNAKVDLVQSMVGIGVEGRE